MARAAKHQRARQARQRDYLTPGCMISSPQKSRTQTGEVGVPAELPGRGNASDEGSSLGDGVDKSFISEDRHGVPGTGPADPVLLDKVGLAR